jgi:kynurenine formamidase
MGLIGPEMLRDYAKRLKNWGKWGPDDEIGTLNYVQPEDIVKAASLIKHGRVFPLAIDFNGNGPQRGERGRNNPSRTMLFTGADHVANYNNGAQIRSADDVITMPLQCATHWDALGHIFFDDFEGNLYMWNGYSPANVTTQNGCEKCGIQHTKAKMVGRGVLLDVARFKGMEAMAPGEGITSEELDACAAAQGVEIRRGDFVLIRTGDLDRRLKEGSWGTFAGGDAPGLEFETLEWLHKKEMAAIGVDTWGCEVRPNRTNGIRQPWHWICIPILGLTMGEMFKLGELAEDCAKDGVYEFFFVAPTIPFTNATASPVNPLAIK